MTAPASHDVNFSGVNNEQDLKLLEGGEAVKVIVGDPEYPKTWSLPKNLLVHISPFFDATLNGSFAEASSKIITFPEDDPAAFEMFVQWMYVGKTGRNSTEDIAIHIESWTLGDKLGCPVFQDRAMLKLLHLHSANLIQPKTLQRAYEGSVAGSKLRKWALQHFIFNVQFENFVTNLDNWAAVAKATADFGSDYVAASAATFKDLWLNPIENGQLYLEVLAYKDERLDKLKDPINITVRVGTQDSSAEWYLPKALLTHYLPSFAAALDEHFAEAKSNRVLLPDENSGVFETFVQWLYTGEMQFNIRPEDPYEDWSGLLVDSWILGDKLRCQAFQDSAMIQLLTYHEKHAIEPSTVCEAYQGPTPGSKLRKWAIDQFLYDIKAAEYEDSAEEKQDWMSQVELIENFGQDFINAFLGWGSVDVVDPYMNGQKYMEVPTYKHDNSCECSRCGRRSPEVRQQEI